MGIRFQNYEVNPNKKSNFGPPVQGGSHHAGYRPSLRDHQAKGEANPRPPGGGYTQGWTVQAVRKFGRKSLRDIKLANNRADAYYASMAGVPPRAQNVIEPARVRKPSAKKQQPERLALAKILKALREHPAVAIVDRRQSGLFKSEERTIRVGKVGVLDISGMLCGGTYFEIEVKSATGKLTPEQVQRIDRVKYYGGLAGMARSVEDALLILEE